MSESRDFVNRVVERVALQPDVARAVREAIALGVPLMICHALGRNVDAPFVAMAAQTIALQDLRGAYVMRLAILCTMTLVIAASALLGVVSAGSVVTATLSMGLMAVLATCWRHLSADYGPALGVSSVLLFLLGLSEPSRFSLGMHLAGLVVIGGAGATLLQTGFWLFRPQHPLRFAVAETWMAASDLAAEMRPTEIRDDRSRSEAVANRERELRAALDRTFAILSAAEIPRRAAFIAHLEEMRREVVHLVMRLIAFNASLEPLLGEAGFSRHLPTVDSVLKTVSSAARSVAITLVTHREENLAASELRIRRCRDLVRVLDEQLANDAAAQPLIASLRAALAQIAQVLPRIRAGLGETMAHAAARFAFPPSLPELSARSLHSIAAWINPAPRVDPVLVRYGGRMAVLTMLAVACYKTFSISRGYWIALTIMVVLQPDYGSTRQRAAQRIGGTLAGSLLGSAILWIKMPLFLLDAFAALMCAGFAYFLRRRYSAAVFFVTLMVVLITETMMPVHLGFTAARLFSTLLGGGVALFAALVFWPAWEREKFGALLAEAIRANRVFLESLAGVSTGDETRVTDPLMAKRRAENANRFVAASLQRLLAEPGSSTERGESSAALATYNQRITRAFTALAVHLEDGAAFDESAFREVAGEIGAMLERLAAAVEKNTGDERLRENLTANLSKLERVMSAKPVTASVAGGAQPASRIAPLWIQLAKSVAELRAMILALDSAHSASPSIAAVES